MSTTIKAGSTHPITYNTATPVRVPERSDVSSESAGDSTKVLGQLIGDDVIGNFDQIIIDQDQDGAIIVTKKKKERCLAFKFCF